VLDLARIGALTNRLGTRIVSDDAAVLVFLGIGALTDRLGTRI